VVDKLVKYVQWIGNKRVLTFEDGSTEEKVLEGRGGVINDTVGLKTVQIDRRSLGQRRAVTGK